jgi:hypothetical protein
MIPWIVPACIVLATGALALGFAAGGWWTWIPPIVAGGFLWLLGRWRRWGWTASVGLVASAGAAAAGAWLGLPLASMLLALIAGLTAWDLEHLAPRLASAGGSEQARLLERRHLRRLLIVNGAGLLLAIVAVEMEFRLSLTTALLLSLLAIVGLSQVVGFLRRETS